MRYTLMVVTLLVGLYSASLARAAYYLGTPHNESNGIYCTTCHNMWPYTVNDWDIRTAANPDNTQANAICQECHAANSTNPLKGPGINMHAHGSSSECNPVISFSTECIQCHDQHTQGQLVWAGTAENERLYLASGTIQTNPAQGGTARTYTAGAVGQDYTVIGIAATITGNSPWTDTAKWTSKGGRVDPNRATDNSRGLILVPNKATHNESYEIIGVTPTSVNGIPGYKLKVKGDLSAQSNGTTFGIIYGQALRSQIIPTGATSASDYRTVKFFSPETAASTYGGYVDLSPNTTRPLGLCQVCHNNPVYWRANGTGTNHNSMTSCDACHNGIIESAGFLPCSPSHRQKISNYNSGGVDCSLCHPFNDPVSDIHSAAVNKVTGGSGCAACHDSSSIVTVLNIDVATRLGVTPYFGDDDTWPVTCASCHPDKIPKTQAGVHPELLHSFGWDGNCVDCHGPTTLDIGRDVHGNTCTICHDTSGTNGYRVRKFGDPSFGVDGTAIGATSATTCTGCHNTQSSGAIHHVSRNGLAAISCTTSCHGVAGHKGNHAKAIADYVNCTSCHATTVGGNASVGAPVDPANNKIHDTCTTCHNTDATLKNLGQVGGSKVIAMPNPTSSSTDGGGTCAACHGEYFVKHQKHQVSLPITYDCGGCHSIAVGTSRNAAVPPFIGAGEVHATNGCFTCHQFSGSLKVAPDGAPGQTATTTTTTDCSTCHIAGSITWSAIHNGQGSHNNLVTTASCASCHGNPTPATSNARDAKIAPYVAAGDVHATGCGLCHSAITGARIVGANGKGDATVAAGADNKWECAECHTATWVAAHAGKAGVDHSGRVDALDSCTAACHTATAGGPSGQMPVDPSNNKQHAACSSCHTSTGGLVSGPTTYGALPISKGDCGTCHGADYFDSHIHGTDGGYVSHDVSYNPTLDITGFGSTAACGTCHSEIYTWSDIAFLHAGVSWVTPSSLCTTCHSYTNADGLNTPPLNSNNNAIATGTNVHCVTCHSEKESPKDHSGGGCMGAYPPAVGVVTVTPRSGSFTSSAPTLTAAINSEFPITTCSYTTDGSTWVVGTVSGSRPWTCTATPTGLTATRAFAMRGGSSSCTGYGASLSLTVDTTPPTTGSLKVSPGNGLNDLSWTTSSDTGIGMRASNTYDVRYLVGATAPTCSTGTSVYSSTAMGSTSMGFVHTGLTNGTQYSYRVCAYDAADNVSTGATGSGTPYNSVPSPVVGTVTVTPTGGANYTSSAPTITASLTSPTAPVTSCAYTTNGSTWFAGTVSGSSSPYACTASPTGLSGALTINVQGTSSGGTASGTSVNSTVDSAGPINVSIIGYGSSTGHISPNWTAASDSGIGLRPTNTYTLRVLTGPTAPTCSTGTLLYSGTAQFYGHACLSGTQYSYRLCAYDAFDNPSLESAGNKLTANCL